MCACDWNLTCTRCTGTPQDYRYFQDVDPAELEDDARDRAAREDTVEVGITRAGR